ncbi:uncharacterized protein LOC144158919 isoform X2 [Haemaphysalis longicornis]
MIELRTFLVVALVLITVNGDEMNMIENSQNLEKRIIPEARRWLSPADRFEMMCYEDLRKEFYYPPQMNVVSAGINMTWQISNHSDQPFTMNAFFPLIYWHDFETQPGQVRFFNNYTTIHKDITYKWTHPRNISSRSAFPYYNSFFAFYDHDGTIKDGKYVMGMYEQLAT